MMKPLYVLLALGAATWTAGNALAETDSAMANNPNPAVNRQASRDYSQLVDHDSAFRRKRIHEECDGIESADLRSQCVASFTDGATTINANPGTGQSYGSSGTGRTD
jgi:hypothetical protein